MWGFLGPVYTAQRTFNNQRINNSIMKMDLGTLLVGLISIGVFALPFVLTIRGRRKKKNRLIKSLHTLAAGQNTTLGEKEFCGNYVIAMDRDRDFVFFQKTLNKEMLTPQMVDLNQIKACRPLNQGSNVKGERIIERLGLQFQPIKNDLPETVLEFYQHEQSFQLSGELQSMEEWAKKINERLKA